MRTVTVYRVDYGRKTKDPIGVVLEMRKTERANNYNDLLRLARRLFASDAADAAHIIIDVSHARRAYPPELTGDRAVGSSEEPTPWRTIVTGSRWEVI